MVEGSWTGTMNLTEPQAAPTWPGAHQAREAGDHYLISGQKIFITYGEHDMAENIVHLVLARTPEAPEGVKGISLFVVPKFLEDGKRNTAKCASIEHKLGIHASPTAVMVYDKAVGYFVGEENHGLEYMFIMMNAARFAVGLEGRGDSPSAHSSGRWRSQKSASRGRDLVQGGKAVSIIHHPDVRRMLMLMKSQTEAMRALAYTTAAAMDYARKHPDKEARKQHQAFVELMIPVVKGWSPRPASTSLARRAGARRHGLHRGDRRRAAPARRAHHHHLRRHHRHPGDGPRRPQDRPRGGATAKAWLASLKALDSELGKIRQRRRQGIARAARRGRAGGARTPSTSSSRRRIRASLRRRGAVPQADGHRRRRRQMARAALVARRN
jgi:alkylation response protein AidB-like acyl-CoA dehydrogenase